MRYFQAAVLQQHHRHLNTVSRSLRRQAEGDPEDDSNRLPDFDYDEALYRRCIAVADGSADRLRCVDVDVHSGLLHRELPQLRCGVLSSGTGVARRRHGIPQRGAYIWPLVAAGSTAARIWGRAPAFVLIPMSWEALCMHRAPLAAPGAARGALEIGVGDASGRRGSGLARARRRARTRAGVPK